jgi:hypothetical protein
MLWGPSQTQDSRLFLQTIMLSRFKGTISRHFKIFFLFFKNRICTCFVGADVQFLKFFLLRLFYIKSTRFILPLAKCFRISQISWNSFAAVVYNNCYKAMWELQLALLKPPGNLSTYTLRRGLRKAIFLFHVALTAISAS